MTGFEAITQAANFYINASKSAQSVLPPNQFDVVDRCFREMMSDIVGDAPMAVADQRTQNAALDSLDVSGAPTAAVNAARVALGESGIKLS